jgi:hypothetical protein
MSDPLTLRDSQYNVSPPFLQGFVSSRYMYAFGAVLDAMVEAAWQGVRARFPGLGTPTALKYVGADRNLDRYASETDDQYAARLRAAFDTWRTAGSAASILNQLAGYFGNPPSPFFIRIVTNSGVWYTWQDGAVVRHVSSPNNWNWDGYSTRWWRFWVIVDCSTTHPFRDEGTWGDGAVWGDGGTWGSTAQASDVSALQSILRKWKPANAQCVNIILSFDNTLFDPSLAAGDPKLPDGNFGNWGKQVSGVVVPARFSSAAYFDGVI